MYGTAAGVAALSAQWTNAGEFLDDDIYDPYTAATVPSLTQVEAWLTQVSNSVDVHLQDEGFSVPIDVASVLSALSLLVEGIVKDLVDFSHGSGRFFTQQSIDSGLSPYMTIDKEISEWVKRQAVGFENAGVPKRKTARSLATFEVL